MNSVTPIVSLTRVVEDRLVDGRSGEVIAKDLTREEAADLKRSLASIQSRGNGLLRFMQA